MLSGRSQNEKSLTNIEVSARNSLMPGRVSLIQMIDGLATQKKLNNIKLSSRNVESTTSAKKELTTSLSARPNSAFVDLKIKSNELTELAKDISGRMIFKFKRILVKRCHAGLLIEEIDLPLELNMIKDLIVLLVERELHLAVLWM